MLPYDHPTLVVLDDPAHMPEVTTHLIRVGFDDVRGYLEGGIDAWENAGYPLNTLTPISVHELQRKRQEGGRLTVLDVRTEGEWAAGHIDGAVHVHGGTLQERFAEVPRDRPVAVYCDSGYRASIAASLLKRNGFGQVRNVPGSWKAWKAAGLKAEVPKEKKKAAASVGWPGPSPRPEKGRRTPSSWTPATSSATR